MNTTLHQIKTIAFYTLIEALRNRLIWLFLAVALTGLSISGFLNSMAITESREIQAAFLAAFLRVGAIFLLAMFVITSLVREFNDKGLELVLALPLSRTAYVFGKLLGIGALALWPSLLFGGTLACFSAPEQAALWTISLLFELWIVAALSLLCVVTFQHVMVALSAVMAFYLLARAMAGLQLLSRGNLLENTASVQAFNFGIDLIAHLLPRLDQFTQTEWIVYQTGTWSMIGSVIVQSALYLALLSGATLFDLYRKNI